MQINELWTLVLAVLAILLGTALNQRLRWLAAGNIPPAVSGGLLFSLGVALAYGAGLELEFANTVRAALLLVFFAGLGLSAKFAGLRRGGRDVLMLCLVIVLTVPLQNLLGLAVAQLFGQPAAMGAFLGSVPFMGGHGTAAAWAQSPEAAGLPGAFELGIAAATLGLIVAGLVAGPIATWLDRHASRDSQPEEDALPEASQGDLTRSLERVLSSDSWLVVVLLFSACLALGEGMQMLAAYWGLTVPGFLTAMFGGIVLTNLADLCHRPVNASLVDLSGTVALRLFLAMSMLAMKLWILLDFAALLALALLGQLLLVVALAGLVFLLLRRNHDAAVAAGGFIGFGLGSMAVGLATMKRLTLRLGPAPHAFLVLTLAASLFADTVNALGITLFFSWFK